MTDCLFCKIANKTIPANVLYEDRSVIAFLDIKPITRGHTLVVPKQHCENLFDAPEQVLADTVKAAKKVALGVTNALGAKACNLGMNSGAAAGQAVMHAHMHVIPRYADDGLQHWPGKNVSQEELAKVQQRIMVQML